MTLVILFHMGVAGVAIGTIISQLISCVLVLTCLYRSEGSYQLRFSKLKINGAYMEQIFQVGVPAGIQSTVINLSNALLQSLDRLRWQAIQQRTIYLGSFICQ